jgi:hypothetical protein
MFKKNISTLIVFLVFSGFAYAESGLEAEKTLNEPVRGDTLYKDDTTTLDTDKESKDKTTSDTSISKESSTESSTSTNLATRENPYLPDTGPLTLLNCSGGSVSVETFNENDAVMWIPYATVSLSNGKSSPLKCATAKCKVRIKARNISIGPITNYWVLKGLMLPTNKDAVSAGCSVY